jgi:uncharacterized protein (TIGR03118 family)
MRRPLLVESLEGRCLLSTAFVQTNLVSDVPGMAAFTDPTSPNDPHQGLVNPWGLVASPNGPWWLSSNGPGTGLLFTGTGQQIPLTVVIPTADGNPQGPLGSPTGIVFNGTNQFAVSENGGTPGPAIFIFDTEDGTISGWNPGVDLHNAVRVVDRSKLGADYTGLAEFFNKSGPLLYAADFGTGTIDVFNGKFQLTTLAGSFTDPNLPAGFTPYGISVIHDNLFVTYIPKNFSGGGLVDEFDPNGNFVGRIATGGDLNIPWGLVLAPHSWGSMAGDLLVGNLFSGHIDAVDLKTLNVTTLMDTSGNPLAIPGLWSLKTGNDHAAGSANTVFFTAGINGYADGLFGTITPFNGGDPSQTSIVPHLTPNPQQNVSTIPGNGDVNPYGIAFVPQGFQGGSGPLQSGDLLVSNFNNSQNLQGTGTTIVRVTPTGQTSVFFQGQPGLGLTTALGVLKRGFVIVGSVPTTDGTSNTIQQGSLLIINNQGQVVDTLTDPNLLNGPWDLTVHDEGPFAQIFVANVLSGTVTRIDLQVPDQSGDVPVITNMVQIGSGFTHRPDQFALEVGPTGLAYDAVHDVLYVASTADNGIFTIPNARKTQQDQGTGAVFVQNDSHLHGPLGLLLAPNGDLIVANGDAVNADPNNHPSEIAEFSSTGKFVGQLSLNPAVDAPFGIALQVTQGGHQIEFAAVNDNTNSVEIWTLDL